MAPAAGARLAARLAPPATILRTCRRWAASGVQRQLLLRAHAIAPVATVGRPSGVWALGWPAVRRFADAGTIQIKTPEFGAESITEGTLMEWQKKVGDFCAKGDVLAVIETDKVSVEVKAEENGMLEELLAKADDTVEVGQVLATMKAGGAAPPPGAAPAKAAATPAAPAAAAVLAVAPAAPKPATTAAGPATPAAAAQPGSAKPAAPKPAPPVPKPPAKGGKKAAVPFWEVAYRQHWYG
uniref:Lipoyl-binding domain-containing protein n=1 Tax=Pyrodinium bahamense TaxID=73915 RepID=A0A7S0F9U4_9DINO